MVNVNSKGGMLKTSLIYPFNPREAIVKLPLLVKYQTQNFSFIQQANLAESSRNYAVGESMKQNTDEKECTDATSRGT
ncbi:hypothetical protein CEXT_726931 [Caerostris extrusa]|uniref:Uncharacterized protein n=1 Tax=Caerostris extrusa TaxID=172846 RepID=A0AAV4NRM3_CAEEX|nr:hypothetical protein CEXT_726931 [Caerostris extrusa]